MVLFGLVLPRGLEAQGDVRTRVTRATRDCRPGVDQQEDRERSRDIGFVFVRRLASAVGGRIKGQSVSLQEPSTVIAKRQP